MSENEGPKFNSFLYVLKDKYAKGKNSDFWKLLVKETITLLSSGECLSSNISAKAAAEFLL